MSLQSWSKSSPISESRACLHSVSARVSNFISGRRETGPVFSTAKFSLFISFPRRDSLISFIKCKKGEKAQLYCTFAKCHKRSQRRLDVNHHQIPVNAPRCQVNSYHRDGQMRVNGNAVSASAYEPNSYGKWQDQPNTKGPPLALSGAANHLNFREDDDDYYTQLGDCLN